MELSNYQHSSKQLEERYRLLELLGRGGMAEVYLAWDDQKKQKVAIKVMIPDMEDPRRPERFLREGKTAASLHHQHVIDVYDYGASIQAAVHNDLSVTGRDPLTGPYIVMEHVKEGDLSQWLEEKWQEPGGACSLDEIVPIFEQVCHAVQYIHNENRVHRDIKPANILFRKLPQNGGQVEVVLSDFGLTFFDDATLSKPYAGTKPYMAPEQWEGDPQKASDIFALGVLLYQLCTGHLPPLLQTPIKPTQLNPALPAALDKVILRALSNKPSERFDSASLFLQAVQKAVSERTRSAVYLPALRFPTIPLPTPPLRQISLPQVSSSLKAKPRTSIALVLSIVTLLMIGIVWVNPSGMIYAAPSATVTITPASTTLQDTYPMQGVTNNTNLDNHQINVRQVTSTETDTKQVSLAHSHQDPQSATGKITFFNSSSDPINILPGTTLQVGNIQIVTDENAVVPAATPISGSQSQNGQAVVSAHAVQSGIVGNITALAINETCCGSSSVWAKNQNAFTGGTDAVDYNYLKPEDVNAVSSADQDTLKSKAQNDIEGQEKSGEELLVDTFNCDPPKTTESIQPNTPVDSSITSAAVTINMSCQAEVFDANAVQAIVQGQLNQKASKDLGAGYVLAGHIVVTQIQPETQPDGTVTIAVTAQGVWYYQWTDAMKQDLLKQIKGKSIKDAQTILNKYPGNAKIAMSNGTATLPNEVNRIKLDIKTVTGLPGRK
jgi:serine/threonine protein kinase